MRRALIILGFIAAVLAVILAATSWSTLSYIPSVIALIAASFGFFMDKQKSKKPVQLIFILTILSLSLATYKSAFASVEIDSTEEIQQIDHPLEKKSEEAQGNLR